MNLIKTSFLTLISTSIKILSGLVINKAVSLYIGPAGLAIIGQFQNTLQLMMTIAKGGINAGVTKYTAEYGPANEELAGLWSTAAKIVLCCSLSVGILLVIFSTYFSVLTFKSEQYSYVFIILGFTLVFFTVNQLLLSIINGLKEIKLFISINITQSLYSLIFTTLLIIFFGLDGALLALVTNQSVVFLTVLWRLRNHKAIFLSRFKEQFDKEQAKKLGTYSLMALTTACTVPISLLLIRNHIGESISWEAAGYWQAIWYISSMYLMVVTTSLSTYYLPRLSELSNKKELRAELKNGYLVITPLVILASCFIFFLKDFIVWLLFSEEFQPIVELFKWQLIGDVIKIMSWLLGYLLVAKAKTKLVVLSEVLFSISLVFFSFIFLDSFGIIGVTYAYALSYSFNLIFMYWATNNLRG